jgi:hypothetical protein
MTSTLDDHGLDDQNTACDKPLLFLSNLAIRRS